MKPRNLKYNLIHREFVILIDFDVLLIKTIFMKFSFHKIDLPFQLLDTSQLHFSHNPFSGLLAEEIQDVIVPHIKEKEIFGLLEENADIVIQLVGKKGRGKTTHLKYLHCFFPSSDIVLLSNQQNIDHKLYRRDLIFVDSIHHWSLFQRLAFYKNNKTIVLTTHHSKNLECAFCGKKIKTYFFKGINPEKLTAILTNRIRLAIDETAYDLVKINEDFIIKLIKHFGDDYRGIINHLYQTFRC